MKPHSVKLSVTPCLRIECKFWLEDDRWIATAEEFGVTVHAASFEQAKSEIEVELGKLVEANLRMSDKRRTSAA